MLSGVVSIEKNNQSIDQPYPPEEGYHLSADLVALLHEAAGVGGHHAQGHAQRLPVGAVRTIDQALQAPEVLHRDMVAEVPDGDGTVSLLGSIFKFAETDLAPMRTPPMLGGDADDVLADVLGKTESDVTALRTAGTIV